MRPLPTISAYLFPVLCAGLVTLAYGGAVHSYFASDDWLMLWHYGRTPISEPWRFFSPEVVWFYRPLQSLQFGLFYSLFGLNALPYNLALLALHALVTLSVYLLARELDTRPGFAAAVTGLFLTQWAYADVLLWKSNLNTLQWALLTLGSGICFLRSLRTGGRGWRAAAFVLGGLAFLAKEMAVNGPLLLALLWAYRELTPDDLRVPAWGRTLSRGVRALWPAVAMALVYVLFHRLCVRDVAEDKTGYFFVSPVQALKQMGFIYNHLLFSFYADPVLVGRSPELAASARGLVTGFLLTPVLLFLVGWRLRDRMLLLGTGWVLLSFLPVVFLRDFHASRFYYLPAFGVAILVARGTVLLLQRLALAPLLLRKVGIAAVALAVGYWGTANLARARVIVREDVRQAEQVRRLFAALQGARGTVESRALVVITNAPAGYFGGGFGGRELIRLSLQDDTLEGVLQGQPVPQERLVRLNQMKIVYTVDASAARPRLERIK